MNAVIYKLVCCDPEIKDTYTGSTLDFKNRRRCHHFACIHSDHKDYNEHKYQFIREHGGWENWKMVEVKKVEVDDKEHLRQIEQEYIEADSNNTLNTDRAYRSKEYTRQYNNEWLKNRYATNEQYREYKKGVAAKHYEDNCESKKAYQRDYAKRNAETISKKRSEKVTCEHCGKSISKRNMSRHVKQFH